MKWLLTIQLQWWLLIITSLKLLGAALCADGILTLYQAQSGSNQPAEAIPPTVATIAAFIILAGGLATLGLTTMLVIERWRHRGRIYSQSPQ